MIVTEGSNSKNSLLLIAASMMEISWLYAIACLLFLMTESPLIPLWAVILSFFVPILLVSILKGRGRRVIEHVILHLCLYLLVLLYTFYVYGDWQGSFLKFEWLRSIFDGQYGAVSGLSYLFLFFWLSYLWIAGYQLMKRSHDYNTITSRFDLGILILVSVFVIFGAMHLSLPFSGLLIIYYFLFSMLAIFLARGSNRIKTGNSKQFSGSSLVLTFIFCVLVFGSWIVLFFLPQLSLAAQAGSRFLKTASKPLLALLLKILLFIFGYGKKGTGVVPAPSGDPAITFMENQPEWRIPLLERIVSWVGLIVLSLFAVMALAWLIWSLWGWFSMKTETDSKKKGFFEELFLWLLHLCSLAGKLWNKIISFLKKIRKKEESISVLFRKLCRWGRFSGIPRDKSKTPWEYGRYLARFFPGNQFDIQLIIKGFNQEIYGKKPIQTERLREAKKAWQRLSRPSKWPSRLRVRIFSVRKYESQEEGTFPS